jgi:hypothetical protein
MAVMRAYEFPALPVLIGESKLRGQGGAVEVCGGMLSTKDKETVRRVS